MPKLTLHKWLNTLIGMFIQGGAAAALATFGLAIGHSIDTAVKPLELKQVGIVFLSGAIVRTLRFLERSPVPEFGDTDAGETEEPETRSAEDRINHPSKLDK